jgi:hypothetical protein
VHVVTHEAVAVHIETVVLTLEPKETQVVGSVFWREEDILTVVASLRDVMRQTGNDNTA